jgi:DNA-directed RNA polymerase III subunit RPC1
MVFHPLNPVMNILQIAVPDRVAKILTYPDKVNSHNIDKLRNAIRNGPDVHPGANHVVMGSNGIKKYMVNFETTLFLLLP